MTILNDIPQVAPLAEPTDARGRVAELHGVRAQALAGPSEKATAAQHAKGKLTARERIELLVDPGS
ncbi:methylmalonyl-CoA carboxyltransferase, partial [Streptomyces rochei]